MNPEKFEMHFEYTFEVVKAGEVIDSWTEKNLIPTQGLNHILDVALNATSQVPTWYVGLYENDYTPVATDTMATFPTLAGEISAYTAATRPEAAFANASGGSVTNAATRAEFIFNGVKTVRGGFICSTNTKGATAGTLVSAVKLGAPKSMDVDSELRVTATLSLTSS